MTAVRSHRGAGLACLAAITLAVVASFHYLAVDFGSLFEVGARGRMARFVVEFFPPDVSPAFLRQVGVAALQTLAVSVLGTAIPVVLGGLLALPAAGRLGLAPQWLARLALDALRSVPELVWAALMVLAAGLGPFAGTLALALHTTGVLGRLFAETIENAPPGPAFALRLRGIGRVRVFLYATLPQIAPQLVSYTLYRWENNVRAAAVLGVVGAGGLGQQLSYHLGLFHTRESCTVLLAMIVVVCVVDALSYFVRSRAQA